MPRQNRVRRTMNGKVIVVIDSIEHQLTVPAFVELMAQALRVMQNIEKEAARS